MTAPSITSEKTFLKHVKREAKQRGWLAFHETYSLGSDKGFPDLLLCHDDYGIVFMELKYGKNKLGPQQEAWRDALRRAGQRWHLFYPADWDDVVRVLDGNEPKADTPDAQTSLPLVVE